LTTVVIPHFPYMVKYRVLLHKRCSGRRKMLLFIMGSCAVVYS